MPEKSITGIVYDDIFLYKVAPVDALSPYMEPIGYRATTEHTGIVEQMHECLSMVFIKTGEENAEQA